MDRIATVKISDLVERGQGPVGLLVGSRTAEELAAVEGVLLNPPLVGGLEVGRWIIADLPELLAERGEWVRRCLADLRAADAEVTVVASSSSWEGRDLEAMRRGLDFWIPNVTVASLTHALVELGWRVTDTTAIPAAAQTDIVELSPVASPAAGLSRFTGRRVRGTTPKLQDAETLVLTAVPESDAADEVTQEAVAPRPFLSVVVRTQGHRLHTLVETLTGLAAQTCDDLEVVLVAHDVNDDDVEVLSAVVAEFPPEFVRRVRVVRVSGGGRSTPLNTGFAAARGRYIAMLDDDDVPFGHWVETFARLAEQAPGRVARTNAIVQATGLSHVNGKVGVRAEHGLLFPYPAHYSLAEHLLANRTPNMAVAIPRGAFHAYGLRFDDSLSTHEDWEFITSCTSVFGTVSSPESTALYRWWVTDESSRTVHSDEDRERNVKEVHRRQVADGVLFHGDAILTLRASMEENDRLREALARHEQSTRVRVAEAEALGVERERALESTLADERERALLLDRARQEEADRIRLARRLAAMLRSRRWRYTRPIRSVQRLRRGSSSPRIDDALTLSSREIRDLIYGVTKTRSWRLGGFVARVRRQLRS